MHSVCASCRCCNAQQHRASCRSRDEKALEHLLHIHLLHIHFLIWQQRRSQASDPPCFSHGFCSPCTPCVLRNQSHSTPCVPIHLQTRLSVWSPCPPATSTRHTCCVKAATVFSWGRSTASACRSMQSISAKAFTISEGGPSEQIPKYAPFLHLKRVYSQPLHVIGTISALECTWFYTLPEHMLRFV